jgi:hypothetical protein
MRVKSSINPRHFVTFFCVMRIKINFMIYYVKWLHFFSLQLLNLHSLLFTSDSFFSFEPTQFRKSFHSFKCKRWRNNWQKKVLLIFSLSDALKCHFNIYSVPYFFIFKQITFFTLIKKLSVCSLSFRKHLTKKFAINFLSKTAKSSLENCIKNVNKFLWNLRSEESIISYAGGSKKTLKKLLCEYIS